MAFNRPTLKELYERLKAHTESLLTGNIALLTRSLLDVINTVMAGAFHLLYGFLDYISKMIMPDLAEDTWLERHGFIWGLTKKAAEFATGQIIITGSSAVVIPAGTLFQSLENNQEYATDNEVTLVDNGGGLFSVNADITAVNPGEESNIYSEPLTIKFLSIVSPLNDVNDDADISSEIQGGVDEESDLDFQNRIVARIQFPPQGGSKTDYEEWAKAVGGVEDAWCIPTHFGAGTAVVVIKPAGTTLENDVQSYIDPRKPVTANDQLSKYVYGITEIPIGYTIAISPNTTEYQNLITTKLEEFLLDEGSPGGTILKSHSDAEISSTGIFDFNVTAMTKDGSSIPVGDVVMENDGPIFEYPVLSTINFTSI